MAPTTFYVVLLMPGYMPTRESACAFNLLRLLKYCRVLKDLLLYWANAYLFCFH